MRFMMIVKANKDTEAGVMPSDELITAMTKYNEDLVKAGALIEASGLQPSSKGFRVRYSSGKPTIIDGPFAETRELIAGYWVIQVKSRQEAVEWAKRIPAPHGKDADGEIEVRQLFEQEDFAPSEAVNQAFELAEKLNKTR